MARVHTIPISNAPLARQHDLYVNYARPPTITLSMFVSVPTGVDRIPFVRQITTPTEPRRAAHSLPPTPVRVSLFNSLGGSERVRGRDHLVKKENGRANSRDADGRRTESQHTRRVGGPRHRLQLRTFCHTSLWHTPACRLTPRASQHALPVTPKKEALPRPRT